MILALGTSLQIQELNNIEDRRKNPYKNVDTQNYESLKQF